MSDFIQILPANEDDLSSVYALIKELAEFEKEPNEPSVSLNQFIEDSKTLFKAIVAKTAEQKIVGMALYYFGYSTWKGKMLYLDDLVVLESYRKQKIGKRLLDEIFKIAENESANQIRWQVLDWNTDAIEIYKKYQVDFYDNWITCKAEKNIIELNNQSL